MGFPEFRATSIIALLFAVALPTVPAISQSGQYKYPTDPRSLLESKPGDRLPSMGPSSGAILRRGSDRPPNEDPWTPPAGCSGLFSDSRYAKAAGRFFYFLERSVPEESRRKEFSSPAAVIQLMTGMASMGGNTDPEFEEFRKQFSHAVTNSPKMGVQLRYLGNGSVAIGGVSAKSPAAEAGLRPGNIIVSANGRRSTTTGDVVDEVSTTIPNGEVLFVIRRSDSEQNITVKVGDGADLGALLRQVAACVPDYTKMLEIVAKYRDQGAALAILASRQQEEHEAEMTKRRVAIQERESISRFVLEDNYLRYMRVKRCHEARDGYLSIFISDQELNAARNAIRRIEEVRAKSGTASDSSGISQTTENIWADANRRLGNERTSRDSCQSQLKALLDAYRREVPDDRVLKKDF